MNCNCCGGKLKNFFKDQFVLINQCPKCDSLDVHHFQIDKTLFKKDYYETDLFNSDKFEYSLKKTRQRQADKILRKFAVFLPPSIQLFDYGCGKGNFLNVAKAKGYNNLCGIESSDIAFKETSKICKCIKVEFNDVKLHFSEDIKDIRLLNKRVLVLLDVIEHFSFNNLNRWLAQINKTFSFPKFLIIKVPSRKSLLFELALLLARFRISSKPLHQLLQVGTLPPHYNFFSSDGLIRLFAQFNYKPIKKISDLDYEIFNLSARIGLKGFMRIFLDFCISPLLFLLTFLLNKMNSEIIIFVYKD